MTLSKRAKARLPVLIDYIDNNVAKAHFNMDQWIGIDGIGSGYYNNFPVDEEHLNSCGTTACAAGWGGIIPSFRKKGFRIVNGAPRYKDKNCLFPSTGIQAVREFFGLSISQANHLFFAESKTPKEWVKLAKRFIADDGFID